MKSRFFMIALASTLLSGCVNQQQTQQPAEQPPFKYQVDQFADLKVLRYQVPGFDSLSLKQKELVYYLSQAALCGRDIMFDQNFKFNLAVRRTCEAIYKGYKGDRETEDFKNFTTYLKRVWFSNGIHHHYSNDKFFPQINESYFAELIKNSEGVEFPVLEGETPDQFITRISIIIFDPTVGAKRIDQTEGIDMVKASAVNLYEGVTQKEVENFYNEMRIPGDNQPVSYGLNSKVVKENGKIVEKKWTTDGLYGQAIRQIVYWLEKAVGVAEDESQRQGLLKLIEYYKTGNLKTWDEYNVIWVQDTSLVDYVNGFIEVYGDPLGMKAGWESVVDFKDMEATHRATTISNNAQWFEDNSPIDPRFKKETVKGVSAKVITVAQLGGDCYPTTPIGINLPNANWIRAQHGSKSVTMENITYAYNQASMGSGFLEEFAYSPEEIELSKKYGPVADNLHTDLHECLGHGSGKLLPGVTTDALRNYHSPIEETRADLFALYYLADPKMEQLGLVTGENEYKAEYISYIRNGMMTQLTRIEPGKNIEQAHMRNRSLIAHWVFEKGSAENVIEQKNRDGKTYFVINDFNKLRQLFGNLLIEVQRITSEGDYEAARKLVENYGVKVDQVLHQEVLERYGKLKLAPYGGFMNPVFVPVMDNDKITDIKVEYPDNFIEQMMHYSSDYSYLPTYN